MSSLRLVARAALLLGLPAFPLLAQQADVSLGAALSFLSAIGNGAQPGLTLTMSGSPSFALRMNGRVAMRNSYTGAFSAAAVLPPWGADLDALFALGGHAFGASHRSPATFAILGVGAGAVDTAGARIVARNWSYGLGSVLPLGSAVDLFLDSRWRMARFVLPTATPRPMRSKEIRVGVTVHAGGGGSRRR